MLSAKSSNMLNAVRSVSRAAVAGRFQAGLLLEQRVEISTTTVDVGFDDYTPAGVKEVGGPIIMLHGVLGNRRNWASTSKVISDATKLKTTRVDLRNHGESPHSPNCSIRAMSEDILNLARVKGLKRFNLVGHSLGGKVAMHTALLHPDLVSKLVVVDIPAVCGKLSDFPVIAMDTMLEIDKQGKMKTIKDLKRIIDEHLSRDTNLRDFILSCSTLNSANPNSNFKANIHEIRKNIEEVWDFPLASTNKTYTNPTLFIFGKKSEFYSDENFQITRKHFPNAQIELLDTGHFVQVEAPSEFVELLIKFFNSTH